MRTVHEVTRENPYTGETEVLHRSYNKREALAVSRFYRGEATYRSYYVPDFALVTMHRTED
jgi:hypothetical protein